MTHLTSLAPALLLNALWQPILVVVMTLLLARILRLLGPVAHLRLWSSSLVLACLLPAVSLLPRPALPSPYATAASGRVSVLLAPAVPLAHAHLTATLLSAALLLWAALTLLAAVRLARGLHHLAQLRHSAQPVILSPAAASLWSRHTAALHPQPTLAIAPGISSPLTLGLRHPAILLPPNLLDHLTPADLATLFAHELTHVRRHDFTRNLALQLLTLPFAFHPVIRFAHARLLEAREWVCDAEAASTLAGPRPFASSLLRLAARLLPTPLATPLAPGLFTRNTLERRIMQLAQSPRPCSRLHRLARLAASAVLALGTAATALALGASSPSSNTTPQTSHQKAVPVQSNVMAGQVLTRVNPVYPPEAKQSKIEGTVKLHATIGADGSIEHLTVVSGPDELRRSALDAVRQWTYKPYLLNGEPTPVETSITVNYSLQP